MSLPSRGIDPNLLTRSQVLPWLSSRFQLGSSRTFWAVIAIAMVIALLFNNKSYTYSLYMIAGLLITVFLFTLRIFMRSTASVILLVFIFLLEYLLVSTEFWQKSTIGISLFVNCLADGAILLVPLFVLLVLDWLLPRLPAGVLADSTKAKIAAWANLHSATTLIMVAVTAATALVLSNIYDRYALIGVIKPERDRLNNVVSHLPVNKSATIKFSFQGPPRKDPKTGEVTRDRNEEVNYEGWRTNIGSAIGGTAFFKGGRAMVPRLIIFVFGYGAFGALVAYFVALSRRRPQTLANVVPVGIGAALVFQIVFYLFANVPTLIVASALLVLASGAVLIGACLKATELDGGAGSADATRLLGASFALPSGPASSPRTPGG